MNTASLKTFVSLFDIIRTYDEIRTYDIQYILEKNAEKTSEFKKNTDKYYTKGKYLIDK